MNKIKKHVIISSCVAVSTITIAALLCFNLNLGIDSRNRNWMKDINESTSLAEISLPGSHDSLALYSLVDVAGKCQDASIAQQLNFGVRFFDVRLQLRNNVLRAVHGIVDEKMTFDTFNNEVDDFLKANPSETVIVSIKKEGDDVKSTSTFEESIKPKLSSYYTESRIPTLKEVRGKKVLLNRYTSKEKIGLEACAGWNDNSTFIIDNSTYKINVQDHYKFDDAEIKLNDISSFINSTLLYKDATNLSLNYFSGYLSKGFPPSYSVPVAKVVNPQAKKIIENNYFVGTCIFDFVTYDLATSVIRRNF